MARAMWLRDVLEDLRQQGVPVHYVSGWETRGSSTFDPAGLICHDTGGSATSTDAGEIGVLINGRTGLPGPIAQLYLSRDTGVHLVASGRCNHVLTGWAGPCEGMGNSRLIGIEAAANPGRTWPAQQYSWYTRLVATICRHRGWSVHTDVAAHREHQPGAKVDPVGIDMATFRYRVQQLTKGGNDVGSLEGVQSEQLSNLEKLRQALQDGDTHVRKVYVWTPTGGRYEDQPLKMYDTIAGRVPRAEATLTDEQVAALGAQLLGGLRVIVREEVAARFADAGEVDPPAGG
jgi:hypothetical protein